MASRFFASGDTDSESEYSDEPQVAPTVAAKGGAKAAAKDSDDSDAQDVRGFVDSSDSEDERREVRSKKDKIWGELDTQAAPVLAALRAKDFTAASSLFTTMVKTVAKNQATLKPIGVPPSFLRCIMEMEAVLAFLPHDGKKVVPIAIGGFPKAYAAFKANPPAFDEPKAAAAKKPAAAAAAAAAKPKPAASAFFMGSDDESDEDEDSEDDLPVANIPAAKKKPVAAAASRFDSEDDDSEDEESEEEDEDESEESEDDDDDDVDVTTLDSGKITRDFWVKKVKKEVEAKPVVTKKDRRQQKSKKAEDEESSDDEAAAAPAAKAAAAAPGLAATEEVTPAMLNKRLREILALRGKRGMDYPATLQELRLLEGKAQDAATAVRIQCLVPLLQFDQVMQRGVVMTVSAWRDVVANVERVIASLDAHPTVRLAEDESFDDTFSYEGADDAAADADDVLGEGVVEDGADEEWRARKAKREEEAAKRRARIIEEAKREQSQSETAGLTYIEGNLYAFVFKIAAEYYRGLQSTDNMATEYVNRLREQPRLLALLANARRYYQQIAKPRMEARVVHIACEYVYYYYQAKLDVLSPQYDAAAAASGALSPVDEYAAVLYASDEDPRARVRALLFQTYHWALHSRYAEARERLLSAHIQDTIGDLDVGTRALYNRTMAQIGLAAFRNGQYRAAAAALAELHQAQSRIKELLAQGTPARDAKEEEVLESKRRVLPYHLHLNVDLIDATYIVSAMLIEVPTIAEVGWHQPRRVLSRPFRKYYQQYTAHLAVHAHADTTRDSIMAAAKALFDGEWETATALLGKLKMWSYVHEAEAVKALLFARVKRDALRTYLLTFASQFVTISLDALVAKFQLDEKTVVRTLSKLAHAELVVGAWEPAATPGAGKCFRVAAAPPSRLQKLSLQFVDKVAVLAERVDKSMPGTGAGAAGSGWGGNSKAEAGAGGNNNRRQNNNTNKQAAQRA